MKAAARRAKRRAKKEDHAADKTRSGGERKPRESVIWVDFGRPQVLSGMSAPNERGELIFYDEHGQRVEPKRIEVGTAYRRAKGPKIITRAETNPADILLDVNHHLASYDWIFAVDTNTKAIGAESVSVTAIVLLRDISFAGPRWSAKVVPQSSLEVRDARVPPERLGWRHLLWVIGQNKLAGRVAVFVDSELGELAALNKREKELLPGFVVSENVTLIYASTDVGRAELVGNKAVAECDRRAGNTISRIEAGESPSFEFQTDIPRYCVQYRLWPVEE